MSFDPKKTDVDEHIDLINTLGDMVDQKEEAKMEKFIETMPTMIQTHLIICENWADVTDKAKSLEHIICKCYPPTQAMPLVTTDATVLGLYSHITHSVGKEEEEIPPPFKGAKPKQIRGRGKPQGLRQNPPKAQEAEEAYGYDSPNNYYHNDNYTTPGPNRGHRPFNGQGGNRQFRGFMQRSRDQRPQYNQCQFQNYRPQRGTSQYNCNQYSTHCKPYFQGNQTSHYRGRSHGQGPQQIRGCSCGRANDQSNNGTYQYQYYTHDQQTEQYGPPCSLCGGFNHSSKHCYKGEHDINNIMEKMSINPHQQQQGNLYQ